MYIWYYKINISWEIFILYFNIFAVVDIIVLGVSMNKYINKIIELAKEAYNNNDIPVGAIVVKNNIIIGSGFNKRNMKNSIFGILQKRKRKRDV